MITEDYVSFDVAKLLKEKGFDEKCFQYWYEENNELVHSRSIHPIQNITNPCFFGPAAPTQSIAMKWLREVHKLHITILWDCGAYIGKNSFRYHIDRMDNYEDKGYNKIGFDSNEEAVEAAIKYCLENLI